MKFVFVHQAKAHEVTKVEENFHHGVYNEDILLRQTLVKLVVIWDDVDGDTWPKKEAPGKHIQNHATYES